MEKPNFESLRLEGSIFQISFQANWRKKAELLVQQNKNLLYNNKYIYMLSLIFWLVIVALNKWFCCDNLMTTFKYFHAG